MNSNSAPGRVLVTGASKGIGRAIALKLGSKGWDVAIHFNQDRSAAESVARELADRSSGLYQADLSQPHEAGSLWEAAEMDGGLSALVNNAGIYLPMDFIGSSQAEFNENLHRTFAVNFASPALLARKACESFEKGSGGKILNVASRVGFKGEAGASFYGASKAALINLTRSLAGECAAKKILVFGIAPGWVETAMAREGMENRLDSILKDIPLRRMASPQDCAEAAGFLLSPGAEYLSGVVIDINGASYFH